jgi:hypothetical protein
MSRSLGVSIFLVALAAGCQQSPVVVRVPEPEPAPAPALAPSLEEQRATRNAKGALGELSPEQIGMLDPHMKSLIDERRDLTRELAQARRAGLMDDNPGVKATLAALDRTNAQVDQYAKSWRDMQIKVASNSSSAELSRLQSTFVGFCDLYLDPGELQAQKPAITGAMFVDVADMSGRRMLKFKGPNGATWLIDPTRIVAVRSSQ